MDDIKQAADEWDKKCEESDRQQDLIDTEIESLLKDDDLVSEIIAENADKVWWLLKAKTEIEDISEYTIDKITIQAIRNLIRRNLEIVAREKLKL